MIRTGIAALTFVIVSALPSIAWAVKSAELYTSASYGYGRVEARMRFAAGDGVVSSFFLWKDGSEVSGTFWNELDFEKLGADCHVETNALYGNPAAGHSRSHTLDPSPCGTYRTYAYEWTPDYIAWLVDGTEIRRETGATATAFAQNATGMQIRFNVWPGDATFGGNFNPNILPVHQYVDWVQFSSYQNGAFTLAWREEFQAGTLPAGWLTANWASPKNLSTHDPGNVNLLDGYVVLSLTADNAVGPAGAMPGGTGGAGGGGGGGSGGVAGTTSGGAAGSAGSAGSAGTAGSMGGAGSSGIGGTAGSMGGNAGSPGTGGTAGSVGSSGSSAIGGTAGSAGSVGAAGSMGTDGPRHEPKSADEGGCNIAAPASGRQKGALGLFGLAAIAALRKTGRRRESALK